MIQKVIQKRRREAEIREQLKVGVRSTGGYCTHVMYIHILVRKFLAISKNFNSYFLELYISWRLLHTCAHHPHTHTIIYLYDFHLYFHLYLFI